MQTILGTGGAIGSALAKELSQYDSVIRLVSRYPKKVNEMDELMQGNLMDKQFTERAVKGSSVAYLTVGLEYKSKVWKEQWPIIMQNVIDACKKHSVKLVFFDNAYMYDPDHLENLTEETPVRPVSKKGKVRAEIAQNLLSEIQSENIEAMIVRSSDFYGPNIRNSVMFETVFLKLKEGKPAIWVGDPSTYHMMTYSPDAAKGTALLGNTPDAYQQVWHLPTAQEKVTGKQWVEMFAKELGKPAKFKAVPGKMVKLIGLFVSLFKELSDVMYQNERNYFFNCNKFMNRFPDFRITSPEEGVREVVKAG
jgi:nucleoside-diphosphate-sugar epimerase